MAQRLDEDPNRAIPPDFASQNYAPFRAALISADRTNDQAAEMLMAAWRTENNQRKLQWAAQLEEAARDQPALPPQQQDPERPQQEPAPERPQQEPAPERPQQELDPEHPQQGQGHAPEAQPPEAQAPQPIPQQPPPRPPSPPSPTQPSLAKPKINPTQTGRAISDHHTPRPSSYAIRKLEKFEWIELWYFTSEGCEDALRFDQGAGHDTFTLAKLDNTVSLRPISAAKASRNALPDENLSWEQIAVAKPLFLFHLTQAQWPAEHVKELATFFIALDSHPHCRLPKGSQVLLAYQA
jgi:hypothetical protein